MSTPFFLPYSPLPHTDSPALSVQYTALLISLCAFYNTHCSPSLSSFILTDRRGANRRDMWEAHLGYSCARTDRRVLCRWMGPSMFSHACLGAYPCRQQQAFRLQTCLLFHIVIKLLTTAALHSPLPAQLCSTHSVFMSFSCSLLHGRFWPESAGRVSCILGRCRLLECV